MPPKVSAGLMMYRTRNGQLQIYSSPGPFTRKDAQLRSDSTFMAGCRIALITEQ